MSLIRKEGHSWAVVHYEGLDMAGTMMRNRKEFVLWQMSNRHVVCTVLVGTDRNKHAEPPVRTSSAQ